MYCVKKSVIMIVTIGLLCFSCIRTQRDIRLEADLKNLKSTQKKLQSEVQEKDVFIRERDFKKEESLDDLRTEIQILSGKIDEVAFKSENKINADLSFFKKELEDVKRDMKKLQQDVRTRGEEKKQSPSPRETPKLSEKELYNRGYKYFTKRKFQLAISDFESLLDKFPKTAYLENVHFFIGFSNFDLNKCEKAILAFEEVVKRFPRSKRIPMINLKQGTCFAKLGAREDARYFFNQVISKFPDSKEAKEAKKELSGLKK